MKILAIETSCDDTGIAVLEAPAFAKASAWQGKFKVLANVVSSQAIHQNYGGVFPMMAKREHQANLVPTLKQALLSAKLENSKKQDANYKKIPNSKLKTIKKIFEKEQELLPKLIDFLQTHEKPNIDAIAVTYGPGLEPCLWVGVNFARALSYVWDIPLIPVNHIEAHILVNFLKNSKIYPVKSAKGGVPPKAGQFNRVKFPAISLVVSGGHTQLILMKGIPARNAAHSAAGGGKYEIIGETRDDAAGECFDKCAKLLGLGYPGGPLIAKIASQWKSEIRNSKSEINSKFKIQNSKFALPRPMMHTKDYDFSFSGLKTAVLYETKDKKLTKEYVGHMCAEIQQAIIDVLLKKTLQAAKDYKAKTIILGGGVSANSELRSQLKSKVKSQKLKVNVIFPEPKLSTDNGLMIAVAASFHKAKKIAWQKLSANANLRIGE